MARQKKARKKRPHRRLSLSVLVILASLASASQNCAQFDFPAFLQKGILSCKERTTATIRFSLDIDNCPQEEDKSHFVYVAQMTSKSSTAAEFCAIRLTQEICFSYKPQNCHCVKEHSRWQVEFEKLMRQSDNGPWLWQTGDGLTQTIQFDVQQAVAVKLAKKQTASAADDSQEKSYGSRVNAESNPRSRAKEHIHTSPSKEQKTPARISLIHTEYLANVEKDANPVHDGIRVTDDDEDDDDDDDDDSFSNSLTTGLVVGTLNVISIVVVLVIVFVCRRRKERRAMGSPESQPPPPPPVWRESYASSRTSQSGVYEEIPAACPSFQNETYLVPVVLRKGCEGNTYMSLA